MSPPQVSLDAHEREDSEGVDDAEPRRRRAEYIDHRFISSLICSSLMMDSMVSATRLMLPDAIDSFSP